MNHCRMPAVSVVSVVPCRVLSAARGMLMLRRDPSLQRLMAITKATYHLLPTTYYLLPARYRGQAAKQPTAIQNMQIS
jgi:hypothetical protein